MAGPQDSSSPLVYPPAVYIDTVLGVSLASTQVPTLVGTPTVPVNNLPDAILIAALRETNNFHVKGPLTINQNLATIPYNFFGDGDWYTSYVYLNSYDVTYSTFTGLTVLGNSPGYLLCKNCFVTGTSFDYTPAMISGDLINCRVGSIIGIPLGNPINCYDCISSGSPFTVSVHAGGMVGWSGGSGGIHIVECDDPNSLANIISVNGGVTIESSCTDGQIFIGQDAWTNDKSNGSYVTDYSTYTKGKVAIFSVHITSAANVGDVLAFTASQGKVKINSIVERSNGNTTANLTTAAVYCETNKVVKMVSPLLATLANLASAGAQVQGVGPWTLENGHTGIITLIGTGNAHVDITLDIEFEALANGACLV